MTTQDNNLTKKGYSIKIGGGYLNQNSIKRKRLYPTDRLTEFLNIDPNNEEKVIEYCNNYKFIPPDCSSWLKFFRSFRKEHKCIKLISLKLSSGQKLSETEMSLIDKKLESIKPKIFYAVNHGLVQINEEIGRNTNIHDDQGGNYLLRGNTHKGTIASLWEDLINQSIGNQTIKSCPNCGKFFLLVNKHKRKFCCDPCRNKYHKGYSTDVSKNLQKK